MFKHCCVSFTFQIWEFWSTFTVFVDKTSFLWLVLLLAYLLTNWILKLNVLASRLTLACVPFIANKSTHKPYLKPHECLFLGLYVEFVLFVDDH